ncbi:sensor histidine kinase [Phaeovulum sp.]|uniref:sensor histidine kinase n=1 Tax=Phaeovulum sp. TaxID=2934796 RepID=UPI0039E39D68
MSAMVFLAVLVSVGVVSHIYVERSLTEELRVDIQSRWTLFETDYRHEGLTPLTELIETATRFTAGEHRVIGLFDPDGVLIAGNMLLRPDGAGWQSGPLDGVVAAAQGQGQSRQIDYLYFSDTMEPYTLVVGQRMDRLLLVNHALFRTLAMAGFVIVLTMLGTGYLLSRKSQSKLEAMEATLAQVSAGDMTARMAVLADNDQIDRIAARMNAQLDRLSRMVVSTRTTAAAVAHDLKSPLARAYLGLGRALDRIDAGLDPQAEVEDTQAELERMTGIFDAYLRLSRIESGGDGAAFTTVDLVALLDDLTETYQMVAEDAGQALRYVRSDDDRFDIIGDPAMLQQMVVNLLQNAVSHGGMGNQIQLCLDRKAHAVRLTVADTGPGIPEAAREAVFEPFHRLDASRRTPGSGLGLALVRAIAERHGAQVTLSDNAPGLRVVIEFRTQEDPHTA